MSTHRFYRNDPQNLVEVRPFDIYVAGLFHRRSLHIVPPIHPPVGGEACNECGASGDMRVERAVSKPSKRAQGNLIIKVPSYQHMNSFCGGKRP